jgi:hypothetical protein
MPDLWTRVSETGEDRGRAGLPQFTCTMVGDDKMIFLGHQARQGFNHRIFKFQNPAAIQMDLSNNID